MTAPRKPSLFDGLNFTRYLARGTGLFVGALALGTTFADYSSRVSAIRDQIKAGSYTVFYLYFGWMALTAGYELVRAKVRYDLAMIRYDRIRNGRRR